MAASVPAPTAGSRGGGGCCSLAYAHARQRSAAACRPATRAWRRLAGMRSDVGLPAPARAHPRPARRPRSSCGCSLACARPRRPALGRGSPARGRTWWSLPGLCGDGGSPGCAPAHPCPARRPRGGGG